jgi:hypothetical protein
MAALAAYIPDEAPEPVVLPGAPTTGEAGKNARAIAAGLEETRRAVAALSDAAARILAAVDGRLSAPTLRSHAWARPALAAVQPLRHIVEACIEFEDALAASGESSATASARSPASVDVRTVATVLEEIAKRLRPPSPNSIDDAGDEAAVAAARAALPDENTLATIARAADMDRLAGPFMGALLEMIDMATIADAVDVLGPHARLSPTPERPPSEAFVRPSLAEQVALDDARRAWRAGLGLMLQEKMKEPL